MLFNLVSPTFTWSSLFLLPLWPLQFVSASFGFAFNMTIPSQSEGFNIFYNIFPLKCVLHLLVCSHSPGFSFSHCVVYLLQTFPAPLLKTEAIYPMKMKHNNCSEFIL